MYQTFSTMDKWNTERRQELIDYMSFVHKFDQEARIYLALQIHDEINRFLRTYDFTLSRV